MHGISPTFKGDPPGLLFVGSAQPTLKQQAALPQGLPPAFYAAYEAIEDVRLGRGSELNSNKRKRVSEETTPGTLQASSLPPGAPQKLTSEAPPGETLASRLSAIVPTFSSSTSTPYISPVSTPISSRASPLSASGAAPFNLGGEIQHRRSCHRCGNMRKKVTKCAKCPHIFCRVCAGMMIFDHGESVFQGGCPKCKLLCCCK